jgi:hypothetical protein
VSPTGEIGPASWRVPTSGGSALVEVAPALFRRSVTVRIGAREVARLRKPNGQQPWVEHALPGDGHELLLVLAWEPEAVSSHLFVDGVNARDGETLDSWRARAPKPMDRYEQNVIHGWVRKEHDTSTAWALLGSVGLLVFTMRNQPLPAVLAAVIGGSIFALICVFVWLKAVERFALWLATKRTWNDGLRAEAVFLVAISPLAALFMLVWLATTH